MKINKHSGNNSGSINKFYLIPCSGINKILPSTTPGQMRLTTYSGTCAIELPVTMDKNGYTEKKVEDATGKWYDISASGFIAGSSPELAKALLSLYEQYVLVYLDNDGNYRLIGSKFEPINILTSFTTGMTFATLKGSTFSFSRKCLHCPQFIQSPLSAGSGWSIYKKLPAGSSEE